ncbi:MAG TPA: serpin family protein [Pyrinomonadaceae bacterium]|nr:serpin family protein [Pyrinomonadaceae bacterium]
MAAPTSTDSDALALVGAFNDFAFRLFAQVIKGEEKKTNVLLSPFGVAAALSVLYLAAGGKTKLALAKTLSLKDTQAGTLGQTYATLREALTLSSAPDALLTANSLWSRRGISLRTEFVQLIKTCFSTEVGSLDFADPLASHTVNDWADRATGGKITGMIERGELAADTLLLLLSVVHFKGVWKHLFDESRTKEGIFNSHEGSTVPVPMMFQSGTYRYCEAPSFHAVELPYDKGSMSMLIFLPLDDRFIESLKAESLQEWLSCFIEMRGDVSLPRLRLSYEVKLNAALMSLGAAPIFRPGADFRNLSDSLGFVTDVKHKATVEITEQGTEAAAVTAVKVGRSIQRSFSFIVDRPFFWIITDNRTGAVIFIGAVNSP